MRVNADVRLIVHKTPGSLLLCYVDHHDKAYEWAVRRKLQTHPKTGAAQLVEIRETVERITVPVYVQEEVPKPAASQQPLFPSLSDDDLLKFGVPAGDRKAGQESGTGPLLGQESGTGPLLGTGKRDRSAIGNMGKQKSRLT